MRYISLSTSIPCYMWIWSTRPLRCSSSCLDIVQSGERGYSACTAKCLADNLGFAASDVYTHEPAIISALPQSRFLMSHIFQNIGSCDTLFTGEGLPVFVLSGSQIGLILRVFSSAPFKPINPASHEIIMFKVLVLLALALGARHISP